MAMRRKATSLRAAFVGAVLTVPAPLFAASQAVTCKSSSGAEISVTTLGEPERVDFRMTNGTNRLHFLFEDGASGAAVCPDMTLCSDEKTEALIKQFTGIEQGAGAKTGVNLTWRQKATNEDAAIRFGLIMVAAKASSHVELPFIVNFNKDTGRMVFESPDDAPDDAKALFRGLNSKLNDVFTEAHLVCSKSPLDASDSLTRAHFFKLDSTGKM
jgi:hypothetical protein